ncbi:MAG: hypothetical protein AMJ62_12660 [Myxococcales bacterium SG8_38]|nr:MAG: hypothetical protein AMJ62_12660 [Myxococcales bacterium SG8_38]
MRLDLAAKELTLKLVYYGPALSGKTSNLRAIHRLASSEACGQLMTLAMKNERTLFFDMLPIAIAVGDGFRVRLKLFSVPGQLMHEATRRLVLQAADGIAFIADSRRSEASTNRESFLRLHRNLRHNGVDPARMPMVVQFNKRDLEDIRSDEELETIGARSHEPIYKAVATRGHGVMQTLHGLIRKTWLKLETDQHLEDRVGINASRSMRAIESMLGNRPEWQAP